MLLGSDTRHFMQQRIPEYPVQPYTGSVCVHMGP
jgi:hypothetical protein